MSSLSIPLGPFQLERPVGRGGMGMVWLGHHVDQGVQVAVKVITGRAASSPEYQAAFAREVHAAAQLEHPGIVWLFDYGRIPKAAARASDFQLVEGSPYLVMEYASQGTLRPACQTGLPWHQLRSTLLSILDALAHAHARGVIHRDIKPDNVLIAGPDDLRPGIKLTDYGIAHPIDDQVSSAGEGKPMGTPHYMAPEQIRADQYEYGAHTDLYALGCMTYKLVTGNLPFQGMRGPPLMYAQLTKEPPPLVPLHPIPSGFDEWLKSMLAKEPADRFQRAADAAMAFASLQPPRSRTEVLHAPDDPTDPTDQLETATLRVVTSRMNLPNQLRLDPSVRPPFPPTWKLDDQGTQPLRLMGAGLGLFGLRPVGFVGREAERDLLWGALQAVHEQRMTQVVVVQGPAGIGRTRLVQWVAERAHEVGGAQVMRAAFSATSSSAERMRKMLVRFVRSWPNSDRAFTDFAGELQRQLGLPEASPHVLLDLVLDPEHSALEGHQRHQLIQRTLEPLAQRRPLVVILDDAQWSDDALKLAQSMLQGRDKAKLPVLLVLTVLDDVLDRYAPFARRLEQLVRQDGAQRITLHPLKAEERHELVQSLLGLDNDLAQRVVSRTDGNPLFATQLIGDWVERGVLIPGPSGFILRDSTHKLPESLQEVWEGRILQLVHGLNVPALEMLERAAILGREVDVWEWQQSCDDPDGAHARVQHVYFRPQNAKLRAQLMERLFSSRLAQSTEDGFVFTHAQFREALLTRASQAGRTKGHHDACANVLLFRLDVHNAERVAQHFVAAKRYIESIPPMFLAVEHRTHTQGHSAALHLLDEVEATLVRTELPDTDRWWAELAARRAVGLESIDKHADAWRVARHAWDLASEGGWRDLKALAALVQGAVSLTAGRAKEAEQFYTKVTALTGEDGDPLVALQAWHQLRQLAHRRRDLVATKACSLKLREAAKRATAGPTGAFGHAAIAGDSLANKDYEDAKRWATSSLSIAEAAHDILGQARAHSLLADIAIETEDIEAARAHFSWGVDRYEAISDSGGQSMRCKWSSWEAKNGHFEQAQHAVEPGLLLDSDDRNLRAAMHVCMLMATAGRGKWPLFEKHLSECTRLLPLVSNPSPLYAELAELAGDLCIQRRQRERAVKAWRLAWARWTALGETRKAARVLHRQNTLGAP